MRKTLIALLGRLGWWLVARFAPQPLPLGLAPELIDKIRELTRAFDGLEGVGGEYKRHQVYARLLKDFPEMEKRHLSLAIELVLNRVV